MVLVPGTSRTDRHAAPSLAVALLLTAALAAGASPLAAKTAPPDAESAVGLELAAPDPAVPLALHGMRWRGEGPTLEASARAFVASRAAELRLADGDLADLASGPQRTGRAVDVVRLRQHVDGIPVLGGEIAVSFDRRGDVVFLANAYRPVRGELAREPRISPAAARRLAGELLAVEGALQLDRTELVVFPTEERAYLAWRVQLVPSQAPIGDWEVLVDAVTGEVLRVADTAHYGNSGQVWLPDPLSSAGATYGDTGYTDGGDADTTQLVAEIVSVPLLDLTFDAGVWSLVGPWADCRGELEDPVAACQTEANGVFDYNSRSDDRFEQVNVYQAIDSFMRYINITLGIPVQPFQYVGGVRFDPHGLSGADNSHYSGGTGIVAFGDGGVDDAEDDDVVIHELGHGIHDWLTSGSLSQVQGLSEGVGDYLAVSYSRSFPGQWGPGDPQYNWVFSWDGHNPFWGGRVTNWNDTNLYTTALGGLHTTGQFWASCNIDVWEAIGAQLADTAMLEGLSMTTSTTNQAVAAQAVITAAEALGFSSGTLSTMVAIFNTNTGTAGCNYGVVSEIFSDGFESGDDGQWSPP